MLRHSGNGELTEIAMSTLPDDDLPQAKPRKSTIGWVLFALILLLFAFGIISFASEYFLGKPVSQVIKDFLFLISRRN